MRITGASEGSLNGIGHALIVRLMGSAGCCYPHDGLQLRQVNRMPGVRGELLEIEELGSTVAFAKWMYVVQIADDFPGLLAKFGSAKVLEQIVAIEPSTYVRHPRLDILTKLELRPTLGDLDGSQLTRPIVDVLKEMPVNVAQMREIKLSTRDAFANTLHDQLPLDCIKRPRIGYGQSVLEDICAGINVWIVAHSAASASALARI